MRLIKEILAPNQAELTGYLPDPSREMPNIDRRPAVLIFPGGGYAMCSDREAEPIAFSYLARGYAAFVLRYTTDARNNTYPAAMQDADAALRQLREQADHYGIDPDKIAFSTGS